MLCRVTASVLYSTYIIYCTFEFFHIPMIRIYAGHIIHLGFFLSFFLSELASKVMVELLGTYTAENASQAREDAQRCILAALADPNTFLLDPLLALKPVRFLEGELIHDLLSVFVAEKLPSYLHFYQHHKEFVHSLGKSIR